MVSGDRRMERIQSELEDLMKVRPYCLLMCVALILLFMSLEYEANGLQEVKSEHEVQVCIHYTSHYKRNERTLLGIYCRSLYAECV